MSRITRVRWFIVPIVAILSFACEQYEYASPTPGILEVHLAVKNTVNDRYIPFSTLDTLTGSQNLYAMVLNRIEVREPSEAKLELFSSLSAIRRNPDGDFFNCLDFSARDSMPLLGIAYIPPGYYNKLILSTTLVGPIVVNNPPIVNEIVVVLLPPYGSVTLLSDINIQESRTTRVTITLDLDQSLIRRADTYDCRPVYYVSSVQQL